MLRAQSTVGRFLVLCLVLAVTLSTPVSALPLGAAFLAPAGDGQTDGPTALSSPGFAAVEEPTISFGSSGLAGTAVDNPTSLMFGPDDRLYVAVQSGKIHVYDVVRNGPNSYEVVESEIITAVYELPNHNDDGSDAPDVTGRLVTGIYVTGTAENPVIYAPSTDPRIEISNTNPPASSVDTNSGIISRLEWDGSQWVHTELVRGLPRSEENHGPNGMVLDEASNTLYVAYGGNTNKGAPSDKFSYIPEYAYTTAILSVDLDAIGDSTVDLPTLQNPDGGVEPWGGLDGANMAILTADSPVQPYATGFRNNYDLVLASDGTMYTIDNGANSGWGGTPIGEGTNVCTNEPNEDGSATTYDGLHVVTEGYYGGHPNPTRGNPDGAGVYDKDGTLVASTAGAAPAANPIECDFQAPITEDGSLHTWTESTNGLTEYTASNFDGAMQGNLLAATFSDQGEIWRVQNPSSAADITVTALFTNFGSQPLDVVAVGDEGPFPGTVWAATYGTDSITVFEPADYGGLSFTCDAGYTYNDSDDDGYLDYDEIDNGADPCSAANKPPDFDGDLLSNLNDIDDDDDGVDDVDDPFQVDPLDGFGTQAPYVQTFNPGEYQGTLLDLGFTGLMTNGQTDYLDMYDGSQLTAGGAAPVLTVDAVPEGDAYKAGNDQMYAFQTGFLPPSEPFVVHTTVLGPFPDSDNGLTPDNYQSQGVQIGPGDQDNYLKLVATANGGGGGVEFAKEVGGANSQVALVSAPDVVGDGAVIDLYLSVDPAASTVTATYTVDGGTPVSVGTTSVPASWVDGTQGLAMGVIATSAGPAQPFPATWGQLDVTLANTDDTGPTASFTGPSSTATGESVTFDASGSTDDAGISSYAWSFGDGTSASGQSVSHAYASEGTYTVTLTVTDTAGQTDSTSQTVSVSDSTTSEEVVFAVNSGGSSYTASDGTVYAADTGYTAGSKHSTSDAISNTAEDVLYQSERYGTFGYDVPVADGEYEVTLHLAEVYWTADGKRYFDASVEGQQVLTGFDIHATVGHDAAYDVTVPVSVTDGNLDVEFTTVKDNAKVSALRVTSVGDPTTDAGPTASFTAPSSAATGESVSFDASGSTDDNGISSYAWSFGDGSSASGQSVSHAYTSEGTYTVTLTVTDTAGQTDSASQTVSVADSPTDTGPTASFTAPSSATTGESVTFDASGSTDDNGISSYAWTFGDGSSASGETVSHSYSAEGTYTVTLTVTDTAGQTDSTSQSVSVTDPTTSDEVVFAVNSGGSSYTASDGTVYAADTGYTAGSKHSTADSIANTAEDVLYQSERYGTFGYDVPVADGEYEVTLHLAEVYWTADGKRYFDASVEGQQVLTGFDIHATVGHDAAYEVTVPVSVTDGNLDVDFTTVKDNAKVSAVRVTSVGDPTTDAGPTASFTAPSSAATGESVSFDASGSSDDVGIASYAWSFGDGSSASGQSVSHSYSVEGTYTVTLTVTDTAGQTDSASQTVSVSDSTTSEEVVFAVNTGGSSYTASDGTVYAGDSATAGTPYAYSVDVAGTTDNLLYAQGREGKFGYDVPVADGDYVVTVRTAELVYDAAGERAWDIEVEGVEPIKRLDVYSEVGKNTAYDVEIPVTVTDGTLNLLFDPVSGYAPPAVGAVLVTTPGSSDGTDAGPTASFTAPSSAATGESVSFDASGSSDDNGISSYAWSFGDGTSASGQSVSHAYASEGTYTVTLTVTDTAGQTDSASQTVSVTDSPTDTGPTASFTGPSSAATGESVTFDASGSTDDVGISSYTWSFGDGSSASGETVSHSYSAEGTYTVTLTVTDTAGQTDSTSQSVSVSDSTTSDEVVFAVNSGGSSYTASDGTVYAADTGYTAGSKHSTSDAISNTAEDVLYQSERYGTFGYDVPVADGEYEVTLHLAEVYWTADGKRYFDASVEGQQVLTGFDIHATVGHDAAYEVTVPVTVTDGNLDVEFTTVKDNAKVSALRVVRTGDATQSTGSLTLSMTPDTGLESSTYTGSSIVLTNDGDVAVDSVTVDLSTALLPDAVWDPDGTAGDTTSKGVTLNADGGTDYQGVTYLSPHDGTAADGYDTVELAFAGFDPGETAAFSGDIDPTSIKGDSAPGPEETGSVSGLELSGATVTVSFADGTTASGRLFADGSDGGSVVTVRSGLPSAPDVSVSGVSTSGVSFSSVHEAATVSTASQTLVVAGTPGSTVRVLHVEGGLYTAGVPDGGYDIDAYEINKALSVSEYTATVGTDGDVSLPVTLTNAGTGAGLNYLVVVETDGDDTGATSTVVVLEYAP